MRFDAPVLLYGAGREARSTLAFFQARHPDIEIFVTADKEIPELEGADYLPPETLQDAIIELGIKTIVKSPGVSRYKPIFDWAAKNGVTITSNLNLWGATYRQNCTLIAITGTKGKSTTATLLRDMLSEARLDVGLAGNVGLAPLDIADKHKFVVMELSSYQTADMNFSADIVALTNLYPEHVDWHGSTARYFADKLHLIDVSPKARLAFGPQAGTHPLIQSRIGDAARLLPALDESFEDEIFDAAANGRLKGQHNVDNAILAARIASELGAPEAAILKAVTKFQPLPHRLAETRLRQITLVDDSISTTPEATKAALAAYHGKKIALIAGGHEREQDYEDLAQTIALADVPVVVCLPVTGTRLAAALRKHAPSTAIIEADTLKEGVRALALRQNQFEIALLSPGAPSYNQFKNFEERGDAFIAEGKTYLK